MLSPRAWLAALIVLATVLFVVGVSIERSDDHHGESASAEHVEVGGGEAGERAEEAEGSEHAEEGAGHDEEETLLGVDVEATPFIVLASILSLALALAAWLRPRSAAVLLLVALAMLAFAIFDVREVAHQFEESEAGLAVVAGLVAALHLGASGVAFAMRRGVERPG